MLLKLCDGCFFALLAMCIDVIVIILECSLLGTPAVGH